MILDMKYASSLSWNCAWFQAKQMLEKAVVQDPTFADAVYDLAEILTKEKDHKGAVEL